MPCHVCIATIPVSPAAHHSVHLLLNMLGGVTSWPLDKRFSGPHALREAPPLQAPASLGEKECPATAAQRMHPT